MGEIKLVVRGSYDSIDATRNVFYLTTTGILNVPSSTGVQTYISSMWSSTQLNAMTSHWSARSVDVYGLIGTNWVIQTSYNLTGIVGANASDDPLPQTSAVVLIARTGVHRVVPKKFIAGVLENYGSQGVLSAPALGNWGAMANAWVTPFTDATIEYTPSTQLALGTFTQLLTAHVSPILGTMRSRKQGVGI